MAKIRTEVDCKCGFSEKIIVSRPCEGSRATGRTTCSVCYSQILYEVTKGDKAGMVQVRNAMLTIAPELQQMMDEEAANVNQETQVADATNEKENVV